ncbi:MAG: CHAT domain-containing protein [Myxococcales bacterium]|nr:CHAT domain-containing protein [Myxococcales bacterium]
MGPTGEAGLDLAGRPAVYAMDLPPRSARPAGSAALLVADPPATCRARREAERVGPGLAAARPTVRRLVGAAATRAAVRAALTEVDHLHYAGHGRYAGFEGWDSALPLRDGPLALGDLLVLPRVPTTVVLSGCETGRAEGAAAQGLGLAHAFLLRGAEAVVAPVRPVDDGAAAAFGEALYAALGDAPDLPAAFARVEGRSEAVDYRVFVP